MSEFMDELLEARSSSSWQADALAAKYEMSVQDCPIEALPMCFNHTTLAVELTSHYEKTWAELSTVGLSEAQIQQKRRENGERFVMLSKTAFVWVMSSVEFTMKRAMEKYPTALPSTKPARKLYLADIIKLSADNGLIDAAPRPLWFGANTIRNRVVHNNGVGDAAAKWEYPNGVSVTMEDGKMIQGTIMTFPGLTSWLVPQYADWCDRFLAKAL